MSKLQRMNKDFVLVADPLLIDSQYTAFQIAVEKRKLYESDEAYVQAMTQCCSNAFVFDEWMGTDNRQHDEVRPRPERPVNYMQLMQHWSIVDWEHAFEGYEIMPKLIDLVKRGELFFAVKS